MPSTLRGSLRARTDIRDDEAHARRRDIELVQQAAADDEHRAVDVGEEPREVALERTVIERPREPPRLRVVREVIALPRLRHAACATIKYSYACGESAGTSGSETAHRTSFANGASAASGRIRARRDV